MKLYEILAGLLLASVAPANAATSQAMTKMEIEDAHIHFVHLGGIQSWHAAGDEALFIEGRNRQWYYARLMGPCRGLDFATVVGFVTEPTGEFDRFSAILVDHQECRVMSLVKSAPPPPKTKR